jgi:hypothetical protein
MGSSGETTNMSIQATCDACGKTYSVPDKYAGKRLACKECGETMEVQAEDDFDGPPARSRRGSSDRSTAPARSPKKKPGKKRRKSGPNWLLIGLGGVGGLLAVGGFIWFLMSMLGTSHESLAKDAIAAMEDLGDILADVKDVSSANAAVPRIEKLGDRVASLYEKQQELNKSEPITKEEEKALEEKYKDRLEKAQDRIQEEMKRLSSQRDVLLVLQDPMMNIGRKMTEASRAKAAEQAAAYHQRIQEQEAKARQQFEQTQAQNKQNSPAPVQPQFDPNTGQMTLPTGGAPGVMVRLPSDTNLIEIENRLKEIAGPTQVFHTHTTPQGVTVTIAPMADLDGFVKAVDFGNVIGVDGASRIVTVTPNASYTFKPGGPVAANASRTN